MFLTRTKEGKSFPSPSFVQYGPRPVNRTFGFAVSTVHWQKNARYIIAVCGANQGEQE